MNKIIGTVLGACLTLLVVAQQEYPQNYFRSPLDVPLALSGTFGENEFFSGGLSIRATEDPQMQKIAAKALREGR